jgi:hypothetical protein
VTDEGRISQFALNRDATAGTAGGITTDAIFAWSDRVEENLARFALTRGSAFAWSGQQILESNVGLTAAGDLTAGSVSRLFVESIGEEESAAVVLHPGPGREYTAATFDGDDVDFETLENGAIRLVIHGSGVLELATGVGLGDEPGLPAALRLSAIYPNPAPGAVTVAYEISHAGPVSVRIYNVLGQLVDVVADEHHSPGAHTRKWDATSPGLPSGLYLVEVRSGTAIDRSTFILRR